MIPVATKPHLFWKIVWIDADVEDPGYKFAPEKGWGNDFGYDGEPAVDGVVGFGGDNMPSPEETGYYMVVVNLETEQIAVAEPRSEEHTSELQSRVHLVCRLLLEK